MGASRREFLRLAAAAGVATLGPWRKRVTGFYQTALRGTVQSVPKFVTALRGVGGTGIPLATPDTAAAPVTGALHYSLEIAQYTDLLHPAFDPTTLWGYNPTPDGVGGVQRHLGGIIVARKGTPIQLTFTNRLPPVHPLPVDTSASFAYAGAKFGGTGHNAASVHLHGGFTPWIADGGPDAWFTPAVAGGLYGASVAGLANPFNPQLSAGQFEYYYPNDQSARMMWYHDHARDITRLNAYAGLASAYLLRDGFEENLRNAGLPDFIESGGCELPLVIQDKTFVGPDIQTADPAWTGPSTVGSLWYPHTYERDRWRYRGNPLLPEPSCVPEAFGDTMLVNGTVYPYAAIEARRYRLRVLNACQARFLNLQLLEADASPDGITHDRKGRALNNAGPDFLVIGTEGGFLPHPVVVPGRQPFDPGVISAGLPTMITAPAERWDVIVDFSLFAGRSVILYNDAPAPFPMGDERYDSYSDDKRAGQPAPGFGPDTRILMKFVVGAPPVVAEPPLAIDSSTDLSAGLNPFIVNPPGVAATGGVLNIPPGVARIRSLTLNEAFDGYGRLLQLLGTDTPNAASTGYGLMFDDEITETPAAGDMEIWQIANLTADTHPIHFHLVNVQVLARQPFNVKKYDGVPLYTGEARNPGATELGWKETVQMHPGEVTTVVMRFDLPAAPVVIPASATTGGHEYVWHCHILEHEEHDMMRPLVVL